LRAVSGFSRGARPTAPRDVRATAVYFNKVSLAWRSSTDDVAVVGYDVYEGASLMESVHHNGATLTGLDAGTRYRHTVRARDPSGNVSSMSNAVEVTTPTGDHTPPTAPSHVQAAGTFSRSVELR